MLMSVDRRMFLGGVVASRLAGTGASQPAPMNAPPAQQLSIGVQPGVPNIIRARLVIISGSGPGSGLFVYSGPPANGNLIASITATAGTDFKGNAYQAGINTYGAGNDVQLFNGRANFLAIINPGNLPPSIVGVGNSAGESLELTSGKGTAGATTSVIDLQDSLLDSAGVGRLL